MTQIVIGLPRNMDGQDTSQTTAVRAFSNRLKDELGIPITWQDEAATSAKAIDELNARGKPFVKEDIDALAATYILEDYLSGKI